MRDHRHVFHHKARILLLALVAGVIVATGFVIVAELIYPRGGVGAIIVLAGGVMVMPAGSAYRRVVEEKAVGGMCAMCEEGM